MTNELHEALERFNSLPDDAILPSRITGIILGLSERTVRYHPHLPRVQISRKRADEFGRRISSLTALGQGQEPESASGYVDMIKSDLIERIASQNPHLYQRDVENIVSAIFDEIVKALGRGDRVELRGFAPKIRGARKGRNPKTGAEVQVAQKSHSVLQDWKRNARAA